MCKDIDHPEVPFGDYCDKCPYWCIKDDLPHQFNGYCNLLKKSDIDLTYERELINTKTGEIVKGEDLPFPVSLLWDGCKECGININYDDEE